VRYQSRFSRFRAHFGQCASRRSELGIMTLIRTARLFGNRAPSGGSRPQARA
jgi:hypothetical protein